jgi:sugar phosphate isomerase/epimerase
MDLVHAGRVHAPLLRTLVSACRGRSLRFTVHGPKSINFFDDPDRLPLHFSVLETSLDVAAEVGAIHYVVHGGRTVTRALPEIEFRYGQQRDWLRRAGDLAAARGQLLCVETMIGGSEGRIHTATPSRLANEIEEISHPNVRATLDFSHAHQRIGFHGGDFVAEAARLSPFANHLHVHDSFGRPETITTYSTAECLAFGLGDLHLPVGWGNVPWSELMAQCRFPRPTVFNIELRPRYWYEVKACIAATRALAERARFIDPDGELLLTEAARGAS